MTIYEFFYKYRNIPGRKFEMDNLLRFKMVIGRSIHKIGPPHSGSPFFLIMSMITDRIGRHEVLLPINYNHYNFRENKGILICERAFNANYPKLGKISPAKTLLNVSVTNSSILENPQFEGYVVVAMVTLINSVIGGFS